MKIDKVIFMTTLVGTLVALALKPVVTKYSGVAL